MAVLLLSSWEFDLPTEAWPCSMFIMESIHLRAIMLLFVYFGGRKIMIGIAVDLSSVQLGVVL